MTETSINTTALDAATLVEDYLRAWNDTDPDSRRRLIEDRWTPDATYVDPLGAAAGHAQIVALIGGVQEQFPGWQFTLAGPVDAHHDLVRFTWALGPAGTSGEDAPIIGFDVAETAGGAIRAVHGFLDRVPTA